MKNKFSMNEKVVVGKGIIGTVEQIKETNMYFKDGRKSSAYEYLVQYGEPWCKEWFIEFKLKSYLNDEIAVNKALINVNLLYNLEFAKQLKYENDQLEAAKREAN
ncbi:hypothetical protein [Metabacillus sp. Hm71]|uniref:hypothetical protein n=1 Tax=Metabacillus sp. Hm71 TaxID=3450743 RepID=UPI003F427126